MTQMPVGASMTQEQMMQMQHQAAMQNQATMQNMGQMPGMAPSMPMNMAPAQPMMAPMQPMMAPAQPVAAPQEKSNNININIENTNNNNNEGGNGGVKTSEVLLAKIVNDMNKEKEVAYPQTWPDNPTAVTCAYCKATIRTKVKHKAGKQANFWCCLTACIIPPFCCLPLCMKSCTDPTHKCPNCKKELGTNKKQVC